MTREEYLELEVGDIVTLGGNTVYKDMKAIVVDKSWPEHKNGTRVSVDVFGHLRKFNYKHLSIHAKVHKPNTNGVIYDIDQLLLSYEHLKHENEILRDVINKLSKCL